MINIWQKFAEQVKYQLNMQLLYDLVNGHKSVM